MGIQHSCNAYFCFVLKHFIDDHNANAPEGLESSKIIWPVSASGYLQELTFRARKEAMYLTEDYDRIYGKGGGSHPTSSPWVSGRIR